MLIKQLSVFLENKSGRLNYLTKTLSENGINILTLSIADTMDFGIVRFITRDNDKAFAVLKAEGFAVSQNCQFDYFSDFQLSGCGNEMQVVF